MQIYPLDRSWPRKGKTMSMFDLIRAQMGATVPFAAHAGVELLEVGDGRGVARLAQTPTSINHIGSQHAGALFTLGETASGGAMAGVFAAQILSVRPIAGGADIRYVKVAKGAITATATVDGADDLRARLDADGKVAFDVAVTLTDESGAEVATMRVNWHVKKTG